MGKRKERRLAALSNAGRRVKLDLFAEPTGELGGSTGHDDVGGDIDSKHRDGLPNSPSSSGQQLQNPLLLLGQYSDDELDEGSSKGPNDSKAHIPKLNEEAKGSLDEAVKDLDTNATEDPVAQNDGQQGAMRVSSSLDAKCGDKNESDVVAGDLQNEMVSKDQISLSETSDEQVITDVSLGWKMVMHEESRHYYYWNTETGETSWEVPQVLAQAAELVSDPTTLVSNNGKMQTAAVGADSSNIPSAIMQDSLAAFTIDGSLGTTVVSDGHVHGHGSQMDGWSGEYANEYLESGHRGSDVNANELKRNVGLLSTPYGGDHLSDSKPSLEQQQSEIDFPAHLVKQCESLLQRLKSLEKSKGNLQGQESLSRCILEVEIRLSDFRSLASYGSSLLPFWVHSDRQIKRLESAIDNDMLWTAKSAQDEVEDKHVPFSGGLVGHQKSMGCESKVEADENTSEISNDASAVALKDVYNKSPDNTGHVPACTSLGSHIETSGVSKQVDATIPPEESTKKQGFNVGDDVDMDVDMEVEDVNSPGNATVVDVSVTKGVVQTDQQVQLNPPSNYCSLSPEVEFVVPPPPDDEWIPPPPPDNELVPPPPPPPANEQVPPPPPENLPELSYTAFPSYIETGQSLAFNEYNLSYPGVRSEYYGHTVTEVPSSNIYGLAEGCQIAMPPAQFYYSEVPNTYSESSQVIINPTEPVAYYGLQDGAGSTSLPNIITNISGGVERTAADVPSTSASIQAPASVSADKAVSLPSTTAVPAAGSTASSSVAKVQTKVVRSRKCAVAVGSTLKSNKKVSSLVDKWKAAKEELLEEEEEPKSAYEVLERKRQREIEEWHAKQIASGEAKDNANFQPLGGDWKERVKRKRAQAASESVDKLRDTVEKNQQPDLIELSKDLPFGWQVYWDESSKQVYYGNTITSETTWTKPTK